jgi:hypothetical protein
MVELVKKQQRMQGESLGFLESKYGFPVEVVNLLSVLARIELRRQEKQRASKEVR